MRRLVLAFALIVFVSAWLVPGILVIPRFAPADPCRGRDAQLVVHGPSKHLWLCEDGRATAQLRVGLGRGGLGKRAHEDNKTPIGEYALGDPRPSARFHAFIPVGYPTAEQRRLGYTGSDVGIHGPVTWMRWSPFGATWFNRTRGCIEVDSAATIEQVAAWVRQGRAKTIRIE
jgi:hypothetical protein